MAQRRIIMLGDSLMRQQWMSLACMLNNATVRLPQAAAFQYCAVDMWAFRGWLASVCPAPAACCCKFLCESQ